MAAERLSEASDGTFGIGRLDPLMPKGIWDLLLSGKKLPAVGKLGLTGFWYFRLTACQKAPYAGRM